jgi:hypothetical protein
VSEAKPVTVESVSHGRHIVLTAHEASRFEVMVDSDGTLIVFGYTGTEPDLDQEPDLEYFSGE